MNKDGSMDYLSDDELSQVSGGSGRGIIDQFPYPDDPAIIVTLYTDGTYNLKNTRNGKEKDVESTRDFGWAIEEISQ